MSMFLTGMGVRFTWWQWFWFVDKLVEWGVDTSEIRFSNDGKEISDATCQLIADAIEAHLPEMTKAQREFFEPTVNLWRTCGGCLQV